MASQEQVEPRSISPEIPRIPTDGSRAADRLHRTEPKASRGGEERMQDLFFVAMTELRTRLNSVRGESGQAMVEYGVLLALISVAALAFIPGIGTAVAGAFSDVLDAITGAGS